MKTSVLNLERAVVGEVALSDEIFALEPRGDIIKLVLDWQRAKSMSGTHQTKTISDVSGTTKKPFKQKGTGNARQGSLRAVQMRGGGIAHGPVTRSHATDLPKKVRKLGLRHALSMKFAEGKLFVIDGFNCDKVKTAFAKDVLGRFESKSFFIVDGDVVASNFALSVRNIPHVVMVPQVGANVYDIIKHDCILISRDGINALQERLK